MNDQKQQLKSLFEAGIAAVSGHQSVINAYHELQSFKPDLIVAVGKAASGMCQGALDCFGDTKAIVATKYGHNEQGLIAKLNVTAIESGHPIPDENSLKAGKMLIDAITKMPTDSSLLLLISGGASAIAESLPDDVSLAEFRQLTEKMVSEGLNIGQINTKRKAISKIKDGKLLSHFKGKRVITLAISDVEGDDISIIGSGIGDISKCNSEATYKLIATNEIARMAVKHQALKQGFDVRQNVETLFKDVFELSTEIGDFLNKAEKGIYIWGGEPTIILPKNPGSGGRNQSLALALAQEIVGTDHITILIAGTDGSDGPTNAAGGIIDGQTFKHGQEAKRALKAANAGSYLREYDDIFITGPTGTNVMDLVIALVE